MATKNNTAAAMEAPVSEAQIRAETKAAQMSIRQEERVEIFIERANGKDEPNLFVSVGGVNYLLPRGRTSLVPPEVAYELERSRKAQEDLDRKISRLLERK